MCATLATLHSGVGGLSQFPRHRAYSAWQNGHPSLDEKHVTAKGEGPLEMLQSPARSARAPKLMEARCDSKKASSRLFYSQFASEASFAGLCWHAYMIPGSFRTPRQVVEAALQVLALNGVPLRADEPPGFEMMGASSRHPLAEFLLPAR